MTPGEPVPDPYGFDAAQIELDRLAGLLPHGCPELAELLGERCGFGGSSADYQRLDSSLLQQVLRRRRGLPILLSVVWIEVARRAGAPVCGVALPRGTSWSASATWNTWFWPIRSPGARRCPTGTRSCW
ncbi:hypothetical protein SANTM175S_08449 [Streptomyces antimycoticus]